MTKESEKEKTTTSATERPTLFKFCISSIAAGVCIGIAGLIYSRMVGTELGKFVGALSFSAGLYYVVLKGLTLYTGRIGFLSETVARFAIMLVIVALSIVIHRPFCKYICPLGAFYGLFHKFSFLQLRCNKEACTNCGACSKICKMQVDPSKKPTSAECIRCGDCVHACPTKALKMTFFGKEKSEI